MTAIAQSDYMPIPAKPAELRANPAILTMTGRHQRPSPPSPAVRELEDFKYRFTASVRPRT